MIETVTPRKWIRVNGTYCCVPNKNGSSSFRVAVCRALNNWELYDWAKAHDRGPYTAEEIPNDRRPRYLAVRDPIDRFTSLWMHAQRDHVRRHRTGFLGTSGMLGATPERLIEIIEDRPDEDPHWTRQSFWEAKDTRPVRYDELLDIVGLPQWRKNKADPMSVPELPTERILNHYARDAELWKIANDI